MNYVSISGGYVILISFLYLMAFWNEFEINFLEFISITEVAVVALKALISSFSLLIISVYLSHIYLSDLFPVGGGRNTPEGKFLNKWWKLIYLPFVCLALFALYTEKPGAYFFLAIIFAPVVGIWIANQGFLNDLIGNTELRFSAINALVLIAFLSPIFGQINANSVLNGSEASIVRINNEEYIYVGKLGDHLFALNKEADQMSIFSPFPNKVVFVSNKQLKARDSASAAP